MKNFSPVLRDSTPRFVGPSVRRSVRPSHYTFFGFLGFFASLLLSKWSGDHNYGPCPPARDWGSRVSGLVFFASLIDKHHRGECNGSSPKHFLSAQDRRFRHGWDSFHLDVVMDFAGMFLPTCHGRPSHSKSTLSFKSLEIFRRPLIRSSPWTDDDSYLLHRKAVFPLINTWHLRKVKLKLSG